MYTTCPHCHTPDHADGMDEARQQLLCMADWIDMWWQEAIKLRVTRGPIVYPPIAEDLPAKPAPQTEVQQPALAVTEEPQPPAPTKCPSFCIACITGESHHPAP